MQDESMNSLPRSMNSLPGSMTSALGRYMICRSSQRSKISRDNKMRDAV